LASYPGGGEENSVDFASEDLHRSVKLTILVAALIVCPWRYLLTQTRGASRVWAGSTLAVRPTACWDLGLAQRGIQEAFRNVRRIRMRSMKLFVPAVAMLLYASCVAQASIQIQAGDYIYMTDGIGRHGGVFNAQETNSSTSAFFGDSFQTFCVEFSEFVTLPRTYYVKSLGATATASGNVLTSKAGWIYSYFLDGLLPYQDTVTSTTREKFNNSVQLAIWLEVANANPNTTTPWTAATLANIYIQGGYSQTWVDAFLGVSYSGDHGVQMMNIRASSSPTASHIQDQLVRNTPPPNGAIPEPSALIVWSLLIGSVGLRISRKRRSL
jgi:hypothetical protein